MPRCDTLGPHYEAFVQRQLESGRYSSKTDVLRYALRLMEEREQRLATLDREIARGVEDANAGRVEAAEKVFNELEAKYQRMETHRAGS